MKKVIKIKSVDSLIKDGFEFNKKGNLIKNDLEIPAYLLHVTGKKFDLIKEEHGNYFFKCKYGKEALIEEEFIESIEDEKEEKEYYIWSFISDGGEIKYSSNMYDIEGIGFKGLPFAPIKIATGKAKPILSTMVKY